MANSETGKQPKSASQNSVTTTQNTTLSSDVEEQRKHEIRLAEIPLQIARIEAASAKGMTIQRYIIGAALVACVPALVAFYQTRSDAQIRGREIPAQSEKLANDSLWKAINLYL